MNLRINSLKKFDSIFGRLACSLAKFFVKPRKGLDCMYKNTQPQHGFDFQPESDGSGLSAIGETAPQFSTEALSKKIKILVIRPGGIGDSALLYPAFKVLKES